MFFLYLSLYVTISISLSLSHKHRIEINPLYSFSDGFHKINRIENGLAVIGSGKDDSQWSHPQFVRDKPDLLQNITRKVTNTPFINSLISKKPNSNSETDISSNEEIKSDIAHLVKAVQHLKQRDEETTEKLKTLQEENHQLYSVLMYLREQHDKQSKLIDIVSIMVMLFGPLIWW